MGPSQTRDPTHVPSAGRILSHWTTKEVSVLIFKFGSVVSSSADMQAMLVAQPCPPVCDPMDCSSSDSSVHVILQVRIQSGLSFSSPGDLPDTRIKAGFPALRADSLPSESPRKPYTCVYSPNHTAYPSFTHLLSSI